MSEYQQLCDTVDIAPHSEKINLNHYVQHEDFANKSLSERITAGLQVFLEMVAGEESKIEQVDKVLLDHFISRIDQALSSQLDAILHDQEFQSLESLWSSLKYLVDNTDFQANTKCEILDANQDAIANDFDDATDLTQSGLYKHIYTQEYDTPGGEPFTALVSNFEFTANPVDIKLLSNISKVAAVAHCPFLATANAEFFNKDNLAEINKIEELDNYLQRAEYIRWNSFRETEEARYVGLTLPNFLLRLPYGEQNPVRSFIYEENVTQSADDYCWGAATFALAANMAASFKQHGWCVNIRGPEAGGKVVNLPLHQYDLGRGLETKIPTEMIISETRELELSKLGFIPLSYYKNSDTACFFSAHSTQKPEHFDSAEATANSRINSRLPYIFLSSRLAHYLKVQQRENIGSNKNRNELESELNGWLQTLVTKMNNPGPELAATHPLREGFVEVNAIGDNPGFYKVDLHATPHFQIEGMDVRLTLVAKLPGEKTN